MHIRKKKIFTDDPQRNRGKQSPQRKNGMDSRAYGERRKLEGMIAGTTPAHFQRRMQSGLSPFIDGVEIFEDYLPIRCLVFISALVFPIGIVSDYSRPFPGAGRSARRSPKRGGGSFHRYAVGHENSLLPNDSRSSPLQESVPATGP